MTALESLKWFVPEIFLVSGAFLALLLDLFFLKKGTGCFFGLGQKSSLSPFLGIFPLLILAGTAFLSHAPQDPVYLFYGAFVLDRFTHFFRLAALGIVAVTILTSLSYRPLAANVQGEYYSLFLFMAFGLILMASSTNLLMIFLSVEFVSLLSYLLVGFLKKDARSKEAAVKYLLFGSLASGVMLYGMSLLFGAAGSLDLSVIKDQINQQQFVPLALASLLFFFVGLGFKISMAPFHMWAPDVYEAAPTPVTAFLTVGPKALGFALLTRVLVMAFRVYSFKWEMLLTVLSILTMTIGNVAAIQQTNIKRLLAYSSIAQAGYLLMGLAVGSELGATAVLIYLVAYAFTNLGAFAVVMIASGHFGNDELSSYAGLAKRSPFLAASLTLFLLSLAGIPPLAGFIGKFFVFSGAIEEGFITLAVAAALNSAVAAFYYFRVVRVMYLVPAENEGAIPHPLPLTLALGLMLAGVLVMGFAPAPFITFVKGMLLI